MVSADGEGWSRAQTWSKGRRLHQDALPVPQGHSSYRGVWSKSAGRAGLEKANLLITALIIAAIELYHIDPGFKPRF